MLNFPKPLLPLFQGLPSGYRGWKNTHCYILNLRENNKTQSKEGEWDFYFYQKRGYQFKVDKKLQDWLPYNFFIIDEETGWEDLDSNFSKVRQQIQNSSLGLSDCRANFNQEMRRYRTMKAL